MLDPEDVTHAAEEYARLYELALDHAARVAELDGVPGARDEQQAAAGACAEATRQADGHYRVLFRAARAWGLDPNPLVAAQTSRSFDLYLGTLRLVRLLWERADAEREAAAEDRRSTSADGAPPAAARPGGPVAADPIPPDATAPGHAPRGSASGVDNRPGGVPGRQPPPEAIPRQRRLWPAGQAKALGWTSMSASAVTRNLQNLRAEAWASGLRLRWTNVGTAVVVHADDWPEVVSRLRRNALPAAAVETRPGGAVPDDADLDDAVASARAGDARRERMAARTVLACGHCSRTCNPHQAVAGKCPHCGRGPLTLRE